DHHHSAVTVVQRDLLDKALPDRQLRAVPVVLDAVRVVDQPARDDHLSRRTGVYRRRVHPDSNDDRIALPAQIEATSRFGAVRRDRNVRPGDRADTRRLAHRHFFLAVDFLHQSAARVGDDVGGLVRAESRANGARAAAARRLDRDHLYGDRARLTDYGARGGRAPGVVRQPDDPTSGDPCGNLYSRFHLHRAVAQGAVHQPATVSAARLRQRVVYGFCPGALTLRQHLHPPRLSGTDPRLRRDADRRGGDVDGAAAAGDLSAGAVCHATGRPPLHGRLRYAHVCRKLFYEFVSDA